MESTKANSPANHQKAKEGMKPASQLQSIQGLQKQPKITPRLHTCAGREGTGPWKTPSGVNVNS